jgi:1,4-dihydroxy-2-naphthoyl-CoA hydrolase
MKKSIWFQTISLEELQRWAKDSMLEHLAIVFTEIGSDFLKATMPVDLRTMQPMGILHGGASCALAETLGSAAANGCVDLEKKMCVGLEINVNHIRTVRSGLITGTATPLHLGKSTQVWEIKMENEEKQLIAVSRLTVAILDKKNPGERPGSGH